MKNKEIRYLLSNGMILKISTKTFKRKYRSGWKTVTDTTGVIQGLDEQGYFWMINDGGTPTVSGSFNTSKIEDIFKEYSDEIEKCFLKYCSD